MCVSGENLFLQYYIWSLPLICPKNLPVILTHGRATAQLCVGTQTQCSASSCSLTQDQSLPHSQRLKKCPLPRVCFLRDVPTRCYAQFVWSQPTLHGEYEPGKAGLAVLMKGDLAYTFNKLLRKPMELQFGGRKILSLGRKMKEREGGRERERDSVNSMSPIQKKQTQGINKRWKCSQGWEPTIDSTLEHSEKWLIYPWHIT